MKVFLDTNILLDILLERDGFEDSATLFQWQDEGRLEIFVSVLTMINIAYVYQKTVGQNTAVANLKYLSTLVKTLPMDEAQLLQAVYMEGKDFEDILQAVCAAEGGCDCIITRNEKDYRIGAGLKAKLPLPPVMSPSAFLSAHYTSSVQ